MKTNYMVTLVVAVIVGAVSFFGGMQYQKTKNPSRVGQMVQLNRNSETERRNPGVAGGRVTGEILSTDTNTITVKLADGGSKVIIISDKTTVNKSTDATRDDLKTGVTIAVFGAGNSDGSLSAANIQIDPTALNIGDTRPKP